MNVLTCDVALAAKLKKALAKAGWTEDDINTFAESDNLAAHRKVLLGTAAIQDLPPAEPVKEPTLEPTIVEFGEIKVDYDQTIATKIASNADPKCIGWHNREWATDEKFPDPRKGKKRFKMSAVCFHKNMPQKGEGGVEAWCKENKKILATPKEGIDLAMVSPRPKLDNVMPLALAGQFFVGAHARRHALYFDLSGGRRRLGLVWLLPRGQWYDNWWFLLLEELPSEA